MEFKDYLNAVDQAYSLGTCSIIRERIQTLCNQCLSEFGGKSPEYASMLGELGSFLRGQGLHQEALMCFQKAAEILHSCYGRNHKNYGTALNNLGGIHRLMGKYDLARSEFTECLNIYAQTVGKHHILYASGLNNLSLLALSENKLQKAADLLSQASKILEESPQYRDELAASLVNLGVLHIRTKDFEVAKKELYKAVDLFENELGPNTPHYYAALSALGSLYAEESFFAASEAWYKKAEEAARKLLGPTHPDVLDIEKCISEIKKKMEAHI